MQACAGLFIFHTYLLLSSDKDMQHQNFLLSSSLLSRNTKIKIYRTIILSVVLYGCETWSLTLREEHRLRVLREEGAEEDIWA
jgi:hypothetical protein